MEVVVVASATADGLTHGAADDRESQVVVEGGTEALARAPEKSSPCGRDGSIKSSIRENKLPKSLASSEEDESRDSGESGMKECNSKEFRLGFFGAPNPSSACCVLSFFLPFCPFSSVCFVLLFFLDGSLLCLGCSRFCLVVFFVNFFDFLPFRGVTELLLLRVCRIHSLPSQPAAIRLRRRCRCSCWTGSALNAHSASVCILGGSKAGKGIEIGRAHV